MALENPRSRLQLPLLWLLIFALTSSVVLLLRQFSAEFWQPTTLIAAAVSAWGILTTRYLAILDAWQRNSVRYRAAELVVLAVLLRLLLWITNGFPQGNALGDYLRDPFLILDQHWWAHFVIAVIIWAWSNGLTALFNRLDFSEYELNLHVNNPEGGSALFQRNRAKLQGDYFGMWVSGGLLLIIVTALSTYQLTEFQDENWFSTITRLALPPQLLVNLLLYLFVGLWLLSYVRYMALFSRWLYRGVRPQPQLARAWRRGGLLLLATVGLLCALLPIGSTMPLIWIGRMLYFLFFTIATAITGFINWLLALFAIEERATTEPLIPPIEIPPPVNLETGGVAQRGPLIPAELTGGLTWVVIVVVVIAALLFLTRGQEYGRLGNIVRQLWTSLRDWWHQMREQVDGRVAEIRHAMQQQFGRSSLPSQSKNRLFRINALTPREQIRYFYLATIRRAAEKGVERSEDETPVEFLQTLRDEFPESAEDNEALTSAFLQARYSNDAVEEEAVSVTKQTWKRVRRKLRRN